MLMKRIFCLFLLLLAAAPAQAGAPPSAIAIVDVQRIMQESLAAKSVSQQLEARRSSFQTEIAAEEADLRQAEQTLSKLRETAKPEAYAEREQALRQRFLTVERHVQARRKALDQAYTDSMNAVRKSIVEIVAAVSKEKGVTLSIVKQQVIWNDSAIDITEDVLTRLNKNVPKIEVKIMSDEAAMEEAPVVLKKPKPKTDKK